MAGLSPASLLINFTTILFGVEMMFCLPNLSRRPRFAERLALACPVYLVVFNVQLWNMSGTWLVFVQSLVVFFVSLCVLRALFDAPWSLLFFYGSASYAVEAIVFVIRRIEYYLPSLTDAGGLALACAKTFGCSVVLLVVWVLLVRRYRDGGVPDVSNGYLLFFVGATLLVSNVLSTWARIGGFASLPFAVCSLLSYVLLLVLEFDVFRVSALEHERDLTRRLLRERERQRLASQESIETVNVKFHDLKHQIAALRSMSDSAERERSLADLEWSIDAYDAAVHTGDAAIDAILTEKSMRCWGREIDFTCMVDGPALAALGVVDVYTLLGNALDNAIEAAERVADPEGRIVSLRTERRGSLLYVGIENTCVGTVTLVDGLPATTKHDSENHGFGMRSIRSVVVRHGGNLVVDASEGRFSLSVLVPLAEGTEASSGER